MSRLTKWFADSDEYGHNSCFGGCESCTGVYCDDALEMIKKLAHYEDLEEQGRLIVQKQGQWIPFKLDIRGYVDIIHYECSNCHNTRGGQTMYCPNCGAKMDEVENE